MILENIDKNEQIPQLQCAPHLVWVEQHLEQFPVDFLGALVQDLCHNVQILILDFNPYTLKQMVGDVTAIFLYLDIKVQLPQHLLNE